MPGSFHYVSVRVLFVFGMARELSQIRHTFTLSLALRNAQENDVLTLWRPGLLTYVIIRLWLRCFFTNLACNSHYLNCVSLPIRIDGLLNRQPLNAASNFNLVGFRECRYYPGAVACSKFK